MLFHRTSSSTEGLTWFSKHCPTFLQKVINLRDLALSKEHPEKKIFFQLAYISKSTLGIYVDSNYEIIDRYLKHTRHTRL